MAARKKAKAAKSTGRKTATKKVAKKAPKAAATKKKAVAKKAPTAKAAKPAATAKKPVVPKISAAEALAERIIEITVNAANYKIEDFYAENAISIEPGPNGEAKGLQGLQEKLEFWESVQNHTVWKLRNLFVSGDTIAIEWDALVHFTDGRKASLQELAVHETRNGKIVAERYYYDPSVLAPPAPEPKVLGGPPPDPDAAREAEDPSATPVDALDL